MKHQLLLADALIRLALGAALLAAPKPMLLTLGLPRCAATFWPRVVGVLLVALAVAAALELRFPGRGGLGLAGAFVLNMATAFGLATGQAVGRLELPRRGRIVMWLGVAASVLLGLVELAWI